MPHTTVVELSSIDLEVLFSSMETLQLEALPQRSSSEDFTAMRLHTNNTQRRELKYLVLNLVLLVSTGFYSTILNSLVE